MQCLQAMSHHTTQCGPILSHDTLHHCLSSNNGLENADRELGHPFRYYRTYKHTLTILLVGGCTLQLVFQECIILNLVTSSSQLHSSGMQLIFTVHQTLPFFTEVGLACETRLEPGNFHSSSLTTTTSNPPDTVLSSSIQIQFCYITEQ